MALLLKSIEKENNRGVATSIKPFSSLVHCYISYDIYDGSRQCGGASMHGMVSIDFDKVSLFIDKGNHVLEDVGLNSIQLEIKVNDCIVTFGFSNKEDHIRFSRYLKRSWGRRDRALTYKLK
jgi:hypothetical protein